MIVSIFIRHFRIYKGINYIPLSEGNGFSSIIGENGAGKSSILEALDCCFNKKATQDWPINNEAKLESVSGENFPYIVPVFLIKKENLRKSTKADLEFYEKAEKLSKYLWSTKHKAKGKFDEFYAHRSELIKAYKQEDYLLIFAGRRYNDVGVYFGSYHKLLDFITASPSIAHTEAELQEYFKGFYDYIISHYSYLYIPVETDVQTYTKLETQDMQKLMDKNIQREIENAIRPETIKQINDDLNKFVKDIEGVLEVYEYKGHRKNHLTKPDLVSKIIEAYFSIKVLHKKIDTGGSKRIPVSELSSGEKRKALIDIAYSFLLKNEDRDNNIILAIDEPEASLHISNCYEQFEKLIKISRRNHQILVSTHWYGFLPIVSNGSATCIKKSTENEITANYFNLYNYREHIVSAKKKARGPLPVDYNIKSYNDLIQSIILSLLQEKAYYWIICEGISEKIYFEYYFENEVANKNLRLLPVGGFTEVRKIYNYLLSPIRDPDYQKKGRVLCLIDTDKERVEVPDFKKDPHLFFNRLLLKDTGTILVDVDSALSTPPTEIEDCLNPVVFYHTLQEFVDEDDKLKAILESNQLLTSARYSANFLDLKKSEELVIKAFFDANEGYNKVRFAQKYVELIKKPFFKEYNKLDWVDEISAKLYK